MGKATEAAAALRAQLAEAEKAAKAERNAEAAERKRVQRAKDEAEADAFRDEKYDATAGDYDAYVGVMNNYGGVQIDIAEWSSVQSSASLTREQAEKLRDALSAILR